MAKYVAVHFDKITNFASVYTKASTRRALMNKLPVYCLGHNEYGSIEIFTEGRAKKEIEKFNSQS